MTVETFGVGMVDGAARGGAGDLVAFEEHGGAENHGDAVFGLRVWGWSRALKG